MADAKDNPQREGADKHPEEASAPEFPDRTWDAHRRRQALNGLRLTPAERLRWLEETMEQMRGWVGRAKAGRPIRGTQGKGRE